MGKLSEWRPYERYVQGGMVDGQFLSAAFTLIAAGPPRLANLGIAAAPGGALTAGGGGGNDFAMPIGIVQNINLSHNRAFARFWELGSERSYFVSGRTMGQLGLSRVMYYGPSLLRVLYAYYQDASPVPPTIEPLIKGMSGLTPNPHDVQIPPGYENLFLNLASDLFSQPVGLLLYFRDSNEQPIGAIYLEACYLPSHTIATDAGGTVIQENVAVQFERACPVACSGVAVVSGDYNLTTGY